MNIQSIQSQLDQLELKARGENIPGQGSTRGVAEASIFGRAVKAQGVSAMVNRGMATGDSTRVLWYVDGKRVAASKVHAVISRSCPVCEGSGQYANECVIGPSSYDCPNCK